MRLKFKFIMILFLSTFFLTGTNSTAIAVITLKQASLYPENSNNGRAYNKFAELVHKYTDGQIKVDVYHGGQLGRRTVIAENIFKGGVDIWIETVDVYETYIPQVYFQGMPYLFRDIDHVKKFFKSDWFEKNVHGAFKEKGAIFPEQNFNWIRGPFRVMVSKIPIMTIEDVKKVKLRVYPADTYIRSWQALGANTTSVEWSEVYLALKQNMIQAVTSPMDLVRPMKFTEVAKYITRIDEFPQILIFVMNKKSYEKLNSFQRKGLHQASNEAGDYFAKMNFDSVEVDLSHMIEYDEITYIRPPLKEWREKIKPFYEKMEMEGKIEKGFYNMVQSLK